MTEKKQQHKKKRGKVQHIRGSPKKRKISGKAFFSSESIPGKILADVKNQKVIVYDLGGDFGENMDLMIYGMDGEVPVGIYDGECRIDFEEIVNSVVNI